MCAVCALWELGKLTAKEADKALVELIREDGYDEVASMHYQETIERIVNEDNERKTHETT